MTLGCASIASTHAETAGNDGFLHVLPMPPMPAAAGAFVVALGATGYMIPLLKATELAAGALLIFGRFVPLALTLLAPVLVNIFAFHAFLAPAATGVAAVLLAFELHLAWVHRASFAPLFVTRSPATRTERAARSADGRGASAAAELMP